MVKRKGFTNYMPNKFIYFPRKSPHGYFDMALQKFFNTKSEKREYMNAHGLREDGSMESRKRRDDRLYETAQEDRIRRGMPTESRAEFFNGRK